jgi:3-keto-disaccharide hydrolase
MKYLLLACVAILAMAAATLPKEKSVAKSTHQQNTLTDAEKNDGWVSLFDGKTTNGWHTYNKDKAGSAWQVDDGTLHLNPASKDGGDIVTSKEYSNFDFKAEWKISPNGNSGIIFLVKEDPKYEASYHTGMEMQVLDNDGHPDGKIKKHRAGDLYDLIACSKETVKPVGEWNQVEIIVNNGDLKLFLNGYNVVHTTLWDDAWKQLVAGSKFKEWPEFATFKTGRIDLQDHGNEVWFRNLKIKSL